VGGEGVGVAFKWLRPGLSFIERVFGVAERVTGQKCLRGFGVSEERQQVLHCLVKHEIRQLIERPNESWPNR